MRISDTEYFFSELLTKLYEVNDVFLDCELPNFMDEDNEDILSEMSEDTKECCDLLKMVLDIVKRNV